MRPSPDALDAASPDAGSYGPGSRAGGAGLPAASPLPADPRSSSIPGSVYDHRRRPPPPPEASPYRRRRRAPRRGHHPRMRAHRLCRADLADPSRARPRSPATTPIAAPPTCPRRPTPPSSARRACRPSRSSRPWPSAAPARPCAMPRASPRSAARASPCSRGWSRRPGGMPIVGPNCYGVLNLARWLRALARHAWRRAGRARRRHHHPVRQYRPQRHHAAARPADRLCHRRGQQGDRRPRPLYRGAARRRSRHRHRPAHRRHRGRRAVLAGGHHGAGARACPWWS